MKRNFTVLKDNASNAQMEALLKQGQDLVLLGTKHDYFEANVGRTALTMMKKYPARKILITSPLATNAVTSIREKANSGASFTETYLFAESLAK
jgi:tRNA isopentenyl-2-thiomethyl-A-37 hydroxylase MiaE